MADSDSDGKTQVTGGGGAVDGMTPPNTMQYTDERTQIGPAHTVATPAPNTLSAKNTISKGAGRSVAGQSLGPDILPPGVTIVDLNEERLLQGAPRVEFLGHQCPALNGIPMLKKLGQGGMGAVYYGIHPRLRSEVAVKVLPFHLAEQDPGMVQRFFREAQIAAQVRSPHLVNVTDVNEECGLIYLIMEYVSGCSAGQYLKAAAEKGQNGLSEAEALEIMIAATEGLVAAHNNGVIHRDLKPDNIMIPQNRVTKAMELRNAKLMDLGLARNEESNQSLTGGQAAMGTPGYMAPEQAMDAKTANKQSDVFGMAATLYALLNGKPPFRGETIMKVLMHTMHEPHEPIIKSRPDISPALNDVLEKCLTKKQETRYHDASALLRALQAVQKGLPAPVEGEEAGNMPTYVYTPGTNNAVPGSSGTQGTFLGAPGMSGTAAGATVAVPGAAGSQAAPPPPKKGFFFFGGLAATLTLVVLLGVFVVPGLGKGDGKTDKPGGGAGGGGGGGAAGQMGQQEYDAQFAKFERFTSMAKSSADSGDVQTAKDWLADAEKLQIAKINDPQVNAKRDEATKAVNRVESRAEVKSKLARAEGLIGKGGEADLNDAMDLVEAAMKRALDQADKNLCNAKMTEITSKMGLAKARTNGQKTLSELQTLLGSKNPAMPVVDEALGRLAVIKKAVPPEDSLYGKAADLEKEFTALKGTLAKRADYDKLVSEAKQLQADKKFKEAADKLILAKGKIADPVEASDLLVKIAPQLDAQNKEAIAAEAKKVFNESMTMSADFLKVKEYDKAMDEVVKALSRSPDNADALELKKKIEGGIAEEKKLAREKRNKETFATLIKEAGQEAEANKSYDIDLGAAEGALKSAQDKALEAKALYPDDPQLGRLNDKIQELQTVVASRKKYDNLLKQAYDLQAKDDTRIDEAEAMIKEAIALKLPNSTLAQTRLRGIETKRKELNANKDKLAKYKDDLDQGASFEQKAEKLPDGSKDRVKQFELAAGKFVEAKAAAKAMTSQKLETDAAQKETAVQGKLKKALEAYEAAQLKIGQALAAAKKMADDGDYAGALAALQKEKLSDPAISEREGLYKKALTDTDAAVLASMKLVADSLKANNFGQAVSAVNSARAKYPGRKDVADAYANLNALKFFIGQVEAKAADADSRKLGLLRKFNNNAAKVAPLSDAIQALHALQSTAVQQFASGGMTAAAIAPAQQAFDKQSAAVNATISQLEAERVEVRRPGPGETDVDPLRERTRPPPPGGGGKRRPGEQDVD